MDDPLDADDLRTRTAIALLPDVSSLLRVRNPWPREEFVQYLDALKVNADIPSDAELSRRSGVRSSVLSRWRSGEQQPSRLNLNKVAPVLGVPPVHLWLAAGLADAADLGIEQAPDLQVLPAQYRELLDLWLDDRLTEPERRMLDRGVSLLVQQVRAEVTERLTPPPNRRRRVM